MRRKAEIELEIREKAQYYTNAMNAARAVAGTEWESIHLESAAHFDKIIKSLIEEAKVARY